MTEFQRIEHPAQVMSWAEFDRRRQMDYASGTVYPIYAEPKTLYLDPATGATVLGPAVIVEPITEYERAHGRDGIKKEHQARAMAQQELRGDESHREGCASGAYRTWERDSCSTCALLGWHDDEQTTTYEPNYAGWPLVYVAAREPIPRAWLPALVDHLNDDENAAYRDNLRRHVATFGVRITDEKPGYRLPVPTAEKLAAWLRDHLDQSDDIAAAAREIVEDDDYDAASKRAARALIAEHATA